VRSLTILLIVLATGGCAGSLAGRLPMPDSKAPAHDQLVIHGDYRPLAHHQLFEELTAQRAEMCKLLALPHSDEPIHVYLFESPDRYEEFRRVHYPNYPFRRAFFIEDNSRLSVYAQWGDRMAEDLRHEVTHGYLHAAAPNVPQWIDEGLAKYFEVPCERRGLNKTMLDTLLKQIEQGRLQPDLRRLEQFPSSYNMTHEDYAESWAWAHFLIESRPETLDVLRGYLAELCRDGFAVPISARLKAMPRSDAALVEHIKDLSKSADSK
jgi:hypothetical protein